MTKSDSSSIRPYLIRRTTANLVNNIRTLNEPQHQWVRAAITTQHQPILIPHRVYLFFLFFYPFLFDDVRVHIQQRLVAAIGQWAFDFLFFPVVICCIGRSVFSVAWCNGPTVLGKAYIVLIRRSTSSDRSCWDSKSCTLIINYPASSCWVSNGRRSIHHVDFRRCGLVGQLMSVVPHLISHASMKMFYRQRSQHRNRLQQCFVHFAFLAGCFENDPPERSSIHCP